MEGEEEVKVNETVEEGLAEVGDGISTHGDEERRVREHHSRSRTTGDGDTIAGDGSQAGKFTFH